MNSQRPETPNHALQRTAPGVTACAPARRPAPAAFPHRLRRPPQSLSLGSLGDAGSLMKPTMISVVAALTVIFIPACNRPPSDTRPLIVAKTPPLIVAKDVEGIKALARRIPEIAYSGRDGFSAGVWDAPTFFNDHRKEILETFVVSEVIETPNIALALARFSVGGSLYRRPIWFRKVDGRWLVSEGHISRYDDDPFEDGQKDRAKEIIEKAEKWRKEGARLWFW